VSFIPNKHVRAVDVQCLVALTLSDQSAAAARAFSSGYFVTAI
jgi:hypothetical protein